MKSFTAPFVYVFIIIIHYLGVYCFIPQVRQSFQHTSVEQFSRICGFYPSANRLHWSRSCFRQKEKEPGHYVLKASGRNESITKTQENILELSFKTMKKGGLKLWMMFWFLNAGKESNHPFSVGDISDEKTSVLRVIFTDKDKKTPTGALDIAIIDDPFPQILVQRFEADRKLPYAGELELLDNFVEALKDLRDSKEGIKGEELFTVAPEKDCLNEASQSLSKQMELAKQMVKSDVGTSGSSELGNQQNSIGTNIAYGFIGLCCLYAAVAAADTLVGIFE